MATRKSTSRKRSAVRSCTWLGWVRYNTPDRIIDRLHDEVREIYGTARESVVDEDPRRFRPFGR